MSLIILFWTLSDRRVNEDNGQIIVYVSWYNGLALFGFYCFYVWICANFNRWFRRAPHSPKDDSFMFYEAFEVIAAPTQGISDENVSCGFIYNLP